MCQSSPVGKRQVQTSHKVKLKCVTDWQPTKGAVQMTNDDMMTRGWGVHVAPKNDEVMSEQPPTQVRVKDTCLCLTNLLSVGFDTMMYLKR